MFQEQFFLNILGNQEETIREETEPTETTEAVVSVDSASTNSDPDPSLDADNLFVPEASVVEEQG